MTINTRPNTWAGPPSDTDNTGPQSTYPSNWSPSLHTIPTSVKRHFLGNSPRVHRPEHIKPLSVGIVRSARNRPGPVPIRNSTDGAASASQKPRMGKGQHPVPSFLSSAGLYPNRSGEHDLKARSDAQICPGPSSSSSCRQLVSLFHLAPSIQSGTTSKQSLGPEFTFLATPMSNTIVHHPTTLTIGNPPHNGSHQHAHGDAISETPTSFMERESR
ncbi:hypothetical protein Ac2012v2_003153 [Leucoagaricus gongylophorus]